MTIEGIPEGWELVRVGHPVIEVEWVLNHYGDPILFSGNPNVNPGSNWPIIRKIERPKQYRPFANAAEYEPHRDRWIRRSHTGRPGAKGCYRAFAYDEWGVFDRGTKSSYEEMFSEGRQFDDGTPFGVEVVS